MLYLGDSCAFLRLILEKVLFLLIFILEKVLFLLIFILEKVYPPSEIRKMSGVI
jgi:hypothetical protein